MELINNYERNYKSLLFDIITKGTLQDVRDGNKAYALFGKSIKFNSSINEFPMLTSKQMFFKNVNHELKWMLNGDTNIKYLNMNDVSIWDKWADENGDISMTYGKLFRDFDGVDQIRTLLDNIETDLNSRRHVVSIWHPVAVLDNLNPCYYSFQVVVIDRIINIQVNQRSGDMFVGVPYDVAVWYLFLRLVANKYNLIPGTVKISIGNAHVYKEHYDAVLKYIKRSEFKLPTLRNTQNDVIDYSTEEVQLVNYKYHEFIKAKIIK